ncbi:RidA family protein [Pseudomonas salomonii]|uniref:Enamine deaminase RidA, house cleaning of reactive enamine intermediates, YjgF/YER057c/UK114 family n=1 Tax=Pseudomonas salomonii TaxID=191391 RepID=A0A1H3PTY2_9PSED|nr:RidA family protein [Pseudomonas salomonii]SDZ04423.1 Enamine deaminase RidA, house cleaning of reactive enamine intermediates, YjgF/YER057c/UK114 family [Pseudomonas salomonii]
MSTPEFFVTPGYGDTLREHLHYSQAVKIGKRVETSGQGGWDDELHIPADLSAEIAQAFHNLERTLATAGAGWEHVIHVNSYHVGGFAPEVNAAMVEQYRRYMPNHAPIWTQVGVESLGLPTMRVEIRVTAIIP